MRFNLMMTIYFLLTVSVFDLFCQGDISKVGPKNEMVDKLKYDKIYYVYNESNAEVESDGSRKNPWRSITTALNNIDNKSLKSRAAIFIAAGLYKEETIVMREFVDLFGGFDPLTWERDIFSYSTILDGQKSKRVLLGANSSRLDGLFVVNGLSRSHGGGILCEDTSPQISNCIFQDNSTLEPEDFDHDRIHQEGHHGGAIASLFNSYPVINNNIFYGNTTSIGNGAGIAFYGWLRMKGIPKTEIQDNFMTGGVRPLVKNNVFVNNVAGVGDTNRTRSSNGGAVSAAYEARPILENNVIASNHALGRGDAGGVYSEYFSYPTISSNWIIGNISDDDGGGIYTMKMGHAEIKNNYIAGNGTLGKGVGGIRISKEGRASISKNIIVHNITGGGVDCVDGYMELIDNIIMDNMGRYSIKYTNHFHYFNSSIIEGNIIAGNADRAIIETFKGNDPVVRNNEIDIELPGENLKIDRNDIHLSRIYEISDKKWDKKSFQLKIIIDKDLDYSDIGKTVRIGDFWGVITSVNKNEVYIWGKEDVERSSSKELVILSDYKL